MTDQNMFSEETQTQTQQTTQTSDTGTPPSNPFVDKLSAIKNENGEPKYKDVEAALEALQHSQQFIETLKQEKAQEAEKAKQLEAELEKRQSVDEAVERLMGKQSQEPADQRASSGLDANSVEEMVSNMLSKQRQQEVEANNLTQVVSQLTETYGDKAKEVIGKRAAELNTTPAELETLARTNPSMALDLLSGVKVEGLPATVKTSQMTSTTPKNDLEPPKFEKSIISGGMTSSEVVDAWRQVQNYTNKKLGVET